MQCYVLEFGPVVKLFAVFLFKLEFSVQFAQLKRKTFTKPTSLTSLKR